MTKVTASNISLDVTQPQIKQFFSFCGRIQDISVEKGANHQTAHITFERASAAKTALLLQDAVLGLDKISITSDDTTGAADDDRDLAKHDDGSDAPQEQKPRTAIVAEYLSHGYVLGDGAIARSMEFDRSHGISATFKSILDTAQRKAQEVDAKLKVTDKVQDVDAKYSISQTATAQASSIYTSFQRYLDSSTGNRIRSFYSDLVGSAVDVHNEARRLANIRQGGNDSAKPGDVIHESSSSSAAPPSYDPATAQTVTEKDQKIANLGGSVSGSS